MTITHLIAFNLALCAAIASPGPALLVAIRTTLSSGRSAGLAIGCGLGSMAAIWTLMAFLGLEGIFKLFPIAYTAAKIAGALYLIYIAWSTWKNAKATIENNIRPARHAFKEGFLINILNPKAVLFAAAVLVVIFPAGMSPFEKGLIVANHLFVELIFYSALALLMSTETMSKQYLRAKTWLDRIAATVLGALGVRILTSSE